mmetsp:Transcript_4035/g.11588  ORF Transcript_4035/g.11588 Transcript_4035/m.11588 type:complete len:83 (-) Transcript_4035:2137-2385(-)
MVYYWTECNEKEYFALSNTERLNLILTRWPGIGSTGLFCVLALLLCLTQRCLLGASRFDVSIETLVLSQHGVLLFALFLLFL